MHEKILLEKNGLSGTNGQIVVRREGSGVVKTTVEEPFELEASKTLLFPEGLLQLTPVTLYGIVFCRACLFKTNAEGNSIDCVASSFLEANTFNELKFSAFDECFKFLSTNCCSFKISC